MEKVIVPLWKAEGVTIEVFSQQLLEDLASELLADKAVLSLKVCIVNEHVKPADPYRMVNIMTPPYDAAIIAWLHAGDQILTHEASIGKFCSKHHVYIVTESDRLPLNHCGVAPGTKTDGMNEIVSLRIPDWLDRNEWLKIWHESHTQIAIDTQSTYGYRQNVVARALTPSAPAIDAFIEENFPEKAIYSRMGFYDADGDEALLAKRKQIMFDSCVRFIDFEKIDCIPTSEYIFR